MILKSQIVNRFIFSCVAQSSVDDKKNPICIKMIGVHTKYPTYTKRPIHMLITYIYRSKILIKIYTTY